VLLVAFVTATTDYDKEKKFRALNSVKNDRRVKVLRKGKEEVRSITDIVVGDVVILDTGVSAANSMLHITRSKDWVPADGLYISGNGLAIDESNMTGEPDAIKKNPKTKPFLLSGTQVGEGNGRMLVTAVGMNSEWVLPVNRQWHDLL
jgi:P-type E1-E2 ATPase